MRVQLHLEGTTPLLMHNVQLADPDNDISRQISAITSKRKKTEEDRLAIAKLEWHGGLYVGPNGPVIPGQNVRKMLIQTGKINRNGTNVQRAFIPTQLEYDLQYEGPRNPGEMFDLPRFVHRSNAKVGTSTVMRTRPCFTDWRLVVDAELLADVLDLDTFVSLVERSGVVEGLGDGRSMGYGRFNGIVKADA